MTVDKEDIQMNNISLIPYNTGMKQIRMPEYGRHIQDLIDFCVGIEDRNERLRCAKSIVKIMAKFSKASGSNVDENKFWDHINILSDFKLDIDFPCEVTTKESLNPKPERIKYNSLDNAYKVYGRNILLMVNKACEMEENADREALIFAISNQMKKFMTISNSECATDNRIFNDLAKMSKGKIVLDPEAYSLNNFIAPVISEKGKNKKKRK